MDGPRGKIALLVSVLEILDDDPDPSSSENLLPLIMSIASYRRPKVPRIPHYENVTTTYDAEDFRRHFRVLPRTFKRLVQYLSQVPGIVKPHSGKGRPPVTLEQQVLITLRYLGTQETYLAISEKFDLSPSTCCQIVQRMCAKLCEVIGNIIVWPNTADHVWQVQEAFRLRCGLPGIVGAMDGSHIPIKPPDADEQSYFNRKKSHSIVLQAVCDSNEVFTDVYAGWPGSVHDSRVLRIRHCFTGRKIIVLKHSLATHSLLGIQSTHHGTGLLQH